MFKLDVYEKRKIVKTVTCDQYDLLYGTLEDFLNLAENISDERELMKKFHVFKPLVLDVFENLTEEDLRNVKVKDMFALLMGIMAYAVSELGATSKNV
jgi:hypothetical protein